MASDELFTREAALEGSPARRATILLFLIESRTAHLAARAQRGTEVFLTEEAVEARDLAFLEAFSLGRDPPQPPTVQDLERYAPQWASLVPENPSVRAALARLLGQKYALTSQTIPSIRAALGLDHVAVAQAYRRLYGTPLDTIYVPQATLGERLRWAWAALKEWPELLSPFWTVAVVTFALGMPQAILALPIAVANVGPLAGVFLLLAIGFMNVLTFACMAEACARSHTIRYGNAFLGRLVTDYLGSVSSLILTVTLASRTFLAVLASAVGLGLTLATFTPVPATMWIAAQIVIELYIRSRPSRQATMTVVVMLATINLALLLPIMLLALWHAQLENLLYMNLPLFGGTGFDPLLLQLVLGVMLLLYNGHVYVIQCAKLVRARDPSGRSLILGSAAGTTALTIFFSLWVLAVGSAIAPWQLAGQAGTVLAPLASQVGPSIHILGSILVVVLLGMACTRSADVLFKLVHERLPTRVQSVLMLYRRRGSLILQPRRASASSPRLGLTYLGLIAGEPQFHLAVQTDGTLHRVAIAVPGYWEAASLFDRLPELRQHDVNLRLEVLESHPESVRLRLTSSMRLTYDGAWDSTGLRMADTLTLPDPLRRLVTWMMRQREVGLAEVNAFMAQEQGAARPLLDSLVAQDFLAVVGDKGEPRYRIRLARRQGRQLPEKIWQAIEAPEDRKASRTAAFPQNGVQAIARHIREVMLSEHGRFGLSVSPALLCFLIAEWLLLTDHASFAKIMSFSGVLTNSLVAGFFPILLLLASRRKGASAPGVARRVLGHPLAMTTIYGLFIANIFLHALVIWQHPLARGGALAVGLLAVGLPIVMVRRGVFARRLIVELRQDQHHDGRTVFAVTAAGEPAVADVQIGSSEGEQDRQAASGEVPALAALQYVTFYLPATRAKELKVWAHRVTPDEDSEPLPVLLEVHCGEATQQFDLKLLRGQVVLPLTSEACWIKITHADPTSP